MPSEFKKYRIGAEEIELVHTIQWSVDPGTIHLGFRGGHRHFEVPGTKIAYAIRPRNEEKGRGEALWLVGCELDITGRVETRGQVHSSRVHRMGRMDCAASTACEIDSIRA
jgi:hypothetical protein